MACTIRQMCDFAGWPVSGWLSPGGIPCLGPVFRRGYRVRAKSSSFPTPAVIDVHITPDVGAISSAPRAPVANRAHRRNHLSRSATGRSRGAITRLDVGMGLFGEHARSISELFWSDGGRMRGRARDRLAWSRPDRAPRLALLLWRSRGKGRCRSRALPVDPSSLFASPHSTWFVQRDRPRIGCGDDQRRVFAQGQQHQLMRCHEKSVGESKTRLRSFPRRAHSTSANG